MHILYIIDISIRIYGCIYLMCVGIVYSCLSYGVSYIFLAEICTSMMHTTILNLFFCKYVTRVCVLSSLLAI